MVPGQISVATLATIVVAIASCGGLVTPLPNVGLSDGSAPGSDGGDTSSGSSSSGSTISSSVSASGSSSSSGSTASSSGGGAPQCDYIGGSACDACITNNCCAQLKACNADPSCAQASQCIATCESNGGLGVTCAPKCNLTQTQSGIELESCISGTCKSECHSS